MREMPMCYSQLASSCVTVMIIRIHLDVYWFGVGPNQTNRSMSKQAVFVVILVAAMKREERRACGDVGKTSIALSSIAHACMHLRTTCIFKCTGLCFLLYTPSMCVHSTQSSVSRTRSNLVPGLSYDFCLVLDLELH